MTEKVMPYKAWWAQAFEDERGRLEEVLGERVQGIEHIGGTAVPGLAAKPVIDMMLGVEELPAAEAYAKPLGALGYKPVGDEYSPGRVTLCRPACDGEPAHHLSIVPIQSTYWTDQLAFRDALQSEPELAKSYSELKLSLAGEHHDPESYEKGKSAFIRAALLASGRTPAAQSVFTDLQEAPAWQFGPGVVSRIVEGKRMTVAVVELASNTRTDPHEHEHEQIGLCLEGSLLVTVGKESQEMRTGGSWVIPSGVTHGLAVGEQGAVLVEVFAPIRSDWELKPAASPGSWPRSHTLGTVL